MMKRLDLNLARRPFTNDTLLWAVFGITTVAVLALGAWNITLFASTGSQVASLGEQRRGLEQSRREAEQEEKRLLRSIDDFRSELLASRASFANTIIQQWSFSWTQLFNELERVMPLGVRLSSIRPRVEDGLWVRLDGITKDSAAFWELQENLEHWPVFGSVYPDVVQPNAMRSGIERGELMFALEMEYYPEARSRLGLAEDPDLGLAGAARAVAAPADSVAEVEPGGQEGQQDEPQQPLQGDDSVASAPAPAVIGVPVAAQPGARAGGGRGKRRRGAMDRQVGGVERKSSLPLGNPGMVTPDIRNVQRPQQGAGLDLPIMTTPDGRFVDGDGREIPVEDIINETGGIRPIPAPDVLDGGAPPPPPPPGAGDPPVKKEERP